MFLTGNIKYKFIDQSGFSLEPLFALDVNFEFLHFIPFTWYPGNLLRSQLETSFVFFSPPPFFDTRRQRCPVVVIVSVHLWFAGCSYNIALRPHGQCLHNIHPNSCLVLSPCQPFRLLQLNRPTRDIVGVSDTIFEKEE